MDNVTVKHLHLSLLLMMSVMKRFDANLAVNATDLQNYGLSLIKKEDPSFKASSGWALR